MTPYNACYPIEFSQAMGFEREAVVQALRAAGNNVETAANSLLR
jgi:uncharacterized UBP type Zn finger protein